MRGLHSPVCSWLCHRQRPELGLTQALPWQVLALARQQNKRVKVVGGGHSPSDIACTDGFMIHMGKMNRVLQVLTALSSASSGPQPRPLSQTPSRSSLACPLWPDPLPAPESQILDPQSRALPELAQASCQFYTPMAMVRMSTPFSTRAHIPFGYLEWEVAGANHRLRHSHPRSREDWAMTQLISAYAGLLQVDTEKKQVTVEAGILLADLHPQLDKHGLALSK